MFTVTTAIIIVNNSLSTISGINSNVFKSLRKELSFQPDERQQYFAGGYVKPTDLIDSRGTFPTGLLNRVRTHLAKLGVHHEVQDYRIAPRRPQERRYRLKLPFPPYQSQIDAYEAIMRAGGRGIISAPTGVGKSAIIAMILNGLDCRALIIVPTLELKRQLSAILREFLSAEVGKDKDIWVENVAALSTRRPLKGYDCVIIDEFHHSAAKTYRQLNVKTWGKVYFRIGLTATPYRSSSSERILLESVLSNIVHELSYKDAIASNYILPVEAYYVDMPIIVERWGGTWADVYNELIVNNSLRNECIVNIISGLYKSGLSTLCLVKEIEHGQKLSLVAGCGFANGQEDDCQILIKGFNEGKLTTLIATTGVMGEGIDCKPCEYVIIAGLGKSKSAFLQQVGRAVRRYGNKESAKVIIFRDASHKFTLSHFNTQVAILKEEFGVVPVKLDGFDAKR